jgi:hypothetical protein
MLGDKMKKLTEDDIAQKTFCNKRTADNRIANIMRYLDDKNKNARLQDQSCRFCYHLCSDRIVGTAFTEWTCAVCLKEQPPWPHTGHPMCCTSCAETHELCRRCGGDLHGRQRRRCMLVK